MKPSAKILLSLSTAGLAGAALWLLWPRTAKPVTAPKPALAVATALPAKPAPIAAPAEPVLPERPEEVAATARMYAAHASLRTPEVADPDSAANKQILETMVAKALKLPTEGHPAKR